ncbi:MAG: Xaa-Pro peptidase family protein, partial [Fibrobacterota bacterium]
MAEVIRELPVPQPFIPESELRNRIARLQSSLSSAGLHGAFITDLPDMLYYTGTLQQGIFFTPAEGDAVLFVRRSLDRARRESPVVSIGYASFKDILAEIQLRNASLAKIGIDEGATTLAYFKMLKKAFVATEFSDCALLLKKIRAVKSTYELEKLKKAGEGSRQAMAAMPSLVREGMTEWELGSKMFTLVSDLGKNCLARLTFGSGEFFLGNITFGDNSNYPCAFDGPGGIRGQSPVCPYGGSDRRLKRGDLIFIDLAFPFEEYYVDKTRVFSLGQPTPHAFQAHARCLEVQESLRKRLLPGAIPSQIYDEVYAEVVLPNGFDD